MLFEHIGEQFDFAHLDNRYDADFDFDARAVEVGHWKCD